MATLVITLLPTEITTNGNETIVSGEIRFDAGNYATGGIQAAWDFKSTPNAAFSTLKLTQLPHVSKEPKSFYMRSGAPEFALYPVVVKGSPLPKIKVYVVSSNAEATNASELDTSLVYATPSPNPHWFSARYKQNI